MTLAEELVAYTVQRVLAKRRPELATLERDTTRLEAIKAPFPRISYSDAVKLLQDKGKEIKLGDDFGGDEETLLGEAFDRPVMIHHYPAAIKAFYMKRDAGDPTLALAFDMIASEGYGEIVGGSQREDDLKEMEKRIDEYKLPRQAFEWYLDVRRFGTFPHSGFGLGLERTVAWICGLKHIRETIPFPRMLEKVYP
jgi:asparaginyl-tRNA synthetase